MLNWESQGDDVVLAAAAGERQAFAVFYRRHEPAILTYFRRRTGNAEVAADLTAEVFAAALQACRRYRPGEAPASAWLFGIAQHTLARSRRRGVVEDRARRRLGMAPIQLEDEDLARIDPLATGDEPASALLGMLPADQQAAIRARVLDEQSYDEIAHSLRCSPAVARKRVSRGLAQMRRELGKETR